MQAQTAPQPASISGTVTNSVTGEPILRAHVTVRCMSADRQQGQQAYGALTNEKGEFSIGSLPGGNWPVDVERTGFVAPRSGEAYSLPGGVHKDGIKLTLTPTGAITGRVVNAAGEPVERVNVSVETGNGNSWSATSDDKGQFRIGGLRPGKYRVKATPESLPLPPEIRSDGTTELHDAATYYPDSLGAKMAQPLEVKAGADVSGVDIRLVRTPIVEVSGKVTGVPAGTKNVFLSVWPSGSGSSVHADGTFSIWRLDPGKYTLQAQHQAGQSQIMSAPVEIEVTTANVENLELRMVPPFGIAGQLRFDDEQARAPMKPPTRSDGTAPPQPPPQPRRIELRSLEQQNGQMAHATVADDDSFTLDMVQPGRYRVAITWGTGYVKSLRAGETEVDGDILDVRTGPAGALTVNVSSNFCEVSGTVSDSKGPVGDAAVILVSAEDVRNVRWGRTDSAGSYKFQVPPGKYKLAAVDQSSLSWGMQGPDLEDYETESLDLSAGDKIAKNLVKGK
jgi:hypothetical protein